MTPPTTHTEWIATAQSFERDAAEAERLHNYELAKFYREQALKARLIAQSFLKVQS